MSEEHTTDDTGRMRRLGVGLLIGVPALVVSVFTYSIMHHEIDQTVSTPSAVSNDGIDIDRLAAEARPTTTPNPPAAEPALVKLVQSQVSQPPAPASSPRPTHTPNAYEQWRQNEAMKGRDASPIVETVDAKANSGGDGGSSSAEQSKLQPPASPWTIDEGTLINVVMLRGANSDYPGDLVAQTERPTYDSATGHYLLIPAGSKLIGGFSRIGGPFQERIEIGWHRLILPNNWSMPLPDMPATDTAGYAGVGGDVNHHYASAIGTAALVTLLSAGSSIGSVLTFGGGTVSPYGGGVYQNNAMDQIGMLATNQGSQQLTSTGNKFLQPRLNRPNTVTIVPGKRFDVSVKADLILPAPYTDITH